MLEGDLGNDVLQGDDGRDTATYEERTSAVTATVSGTGGAGAEADTIDATTEGLIGGQRDDHLNGDGNRNTLSGSDGDDTLSGLGDFDSLTGGAGKDSLTGGDATDFVFAQDGEQDQIGCDSLDVVNFDDIDVQNGC